MFLQIASLYPGWVIAVSVSIVAKVLKSWIFMEAMSPEGLRLTSADLDWLLVTRRITCYRASDPIASVDRDRDIGARRVASSGIVLGMVD